MARSRLNIESPIKMWSWSRFPGVKSFSKNRHHWLTLLVKSRQDIALVRELRTTQSLLPLRTLIFLRQRTLENGEVTQEPLFPGYIFLLTHPSMLLNMLDFLTRALPHTTRNRMYDRIQTPKSMQPQLHADLCNFYFARKQAEQSQESVLGLTNFKVGQKCHINSPSQFAGFEGVVVSQVTAHQVKLQLRLGQLGAIEVQMPTDWVTVPKC